MPVLTVSERAYAMLQRLAVPFEDDPNSVVERLCDAEVARSGAESGRTETVRAGSGMARDMPARTAHPLWLAPEGPDDLTYSRVVRAKVGDEEIRRPNWNKLMRTMHVMACAALGSFEELARVSTANLRAGRFEERGFEYLPEADLSIQGQDANLAWKHTLRLAKALDAALLVQFEWRVTEGAAHPGRAGVLAWAPDSRDGNSTGLELLRALSQGLAELYGARLQGVYLFGSYARGEAGPESDVDVLVVLDRIDGYGEEVARSGEIIAELSLEHEVSIAPVFVTADAWREADTVFLANVREEAVVA
jgi:predicted nucleotidyltransferase